MQTAKQMWDEYRRVVLHPHAPADQITETRQAFYAGMLSMLNGLREMADTHSEDDAVEVLDALHTEVVTTMAGWVSQDQAPN